jgi:hypothetical protein
MQIPHNIQAYNSEYFIYPQPYKTLNIKICKTIILTIVLHDSEPRSST